MTQRGHGATNPKLKSRVSPATLAAVLALAAPIVVALVAWPLPAARGDVPPPLAWPPPARPSSAPPTASRPHPQPAARSLVRQSFDHATHRARPCTACHVADREGEIDTFAGGHASCTGDGCHLSDFQDRTTPAAMCGVCHASAEPWRDVHVDALPLQPTDFGIDFPHQRHRADSQSCKTCHQPDKHGTFRHLGGHATCTGDGCHLPDAASVSVAKTATAHPLSACQHCHREGLLARHRRGRSARPFSVRTAFTHLPHRSDPRGSARQASGAHREVACVSCHVTAVHANTLAELLPPTKQTCAPCHDGSLAFKLTGHSCRTCHRTSANRTGE